MYVQYSIYDGEEIAFVEAIHNAGKVPRIGDIVRFPNCEDKRFSKVVNVIWYIYRDADQLVEVVTQVCLEPKCKEPQVKA